jgi:hypothetical protein
MGLPINNEKRDYDNQILKIEERIGGGWKNYFGLENNRKLAYLWISDKKKLLFETLGTFLCLIW